MNQITHWLDNSNVYGSTEEAGLSLRSFNCGKLRTIIGPDRREQLPIDPNSDCTGPTGRCALAGNLTRA